jgi:ketosteroid isomerase-like protein
MLITAMTTKQKKLTLLTFCSILALIARAQNPEKHKLQKIAADIAASNRLYSQGFETHNAALVVNRYSTDGAIMAPNAKSVISPQGFLAFFNGGYDHGIRKISLHTIKLFGLSGAMINEEGSYELQDEKGQTIDKGKYIVVWKKTASGWKMYRDIFNTDLAGSEQQ